METSNVTTVGVKKFLSKRTLAGLAGILVIGLASGAYFLLRGKAGPDYSYVPVTRQNLTEEIALDGKVKAAEEVNLGFERSGKIAEVKVNTGDRVTSGQLLVSLGSADLAAQLNQAQAAYDIQLSRLNELESGARPEDLQISQTLVDNARNSVADAEQNLANVRDKATNDLSILYDKSSDLLYDAYAKATDAVNNKTDGLYLNGNSGSPAITLMFSDPMMKIDLESSKPLANQELAAMKSEIDTMGADQANIDATLSRALSHLENLRAYLKKLNDDLNFAISSISTPASLITSYKTNVNLGLSNLNGAATSINSQIKAIASQVITNQNQITLAQNQSNQAENGLLSAQKALKLKQAGATADQITAQLAAVRQAAAIADGFRAQLNKSVITSPIDGVVSRQDAKTGEIAPANTPLISVISSAKYQLTARAPEASIDRIGVGQIAIVTLDVNDEKKELPAKVIAVDPAATIVNGSPTYKITLEFSREDSLIKDGLTANIKISVAEQKNALVVPSSAIIKEYDNALILVQAGAGKPERRKVETGLSENGLTEIISGLSENDKVASFGSN